MALSYADAAKATRRISSPVQAPSESFDYDFRHLGRYLQVLKSKLRIAVVYGGDRRADGAVIRETYNPRPWKSYRAVAEDIQNELVELGFEHMVTLPDDMSLPQQLKARGIDLVWLNTGGVQGYNPVSHTPAMLEMLGVPYVGQSSLTATILDNKHVFKRTLRALGIQTTPSYVWNPSHSPQDPTGDLRFVSAFADYRGPFILKPVSGRASLLVVVAETLEEVPTTARRIYDVTQNGVLIEPFLPGREFCVSVSGRIIARGGDLIEQATPFAFSTVERVFGPGENIFTSMDVKPISMDRVRFVGHDEPTLRHNLIELAQRIYAELELESIVRVDVRADADGKLYVLEANPKPDLKKPTADVTSLVMCGLSEHGLAYNDLILGLLADRLNHLFRYNASSVDHILAHLR
jgi:D-alanine-D-alanine ligase